MARRKSHKKAAHHKRRRTSRRKGMSGIGEIATGALGVIAGAVAAQYVAKTVNGMAKLSDGTKKIAAGAAPLALGFALPMFAKKSAIAKSLGLGMIAVGGMTLVKDNVKGALGAMPVISGYKRMALAPSAQNTRGVISGLTTEKAAILTA
jgi:X-X-X-Leu-X-X-Gly heptad repeat protein